MFKYLLSLFTRRHDVSLITQQALGRLKKARQHHNKVNSRLDSEIESLKARNRQAIDEGYEASERMKSLIKPIK